ncbi:MULTISPECIES: NB-ARC domain-containing protein [Nostoc]|uniref:NACHT domain-containing protein n=1 Tax=Nostoc paludosum FACHB-159 TaxID=2692908 RepID=A0ABR8KE00_9NOSO|nr:MULTISPECIES: NB-ARC domain-containing protein [Nostoc]MBD2681298.1 NACHT domain-containing protein [Nostoc sp. FACHB-857]MBD2737777.1 NACHT domain-containing protein [Nostoc paludosum FACHB-159]
MDLPTGQRVRGVVLSPKGQAKLQNRMLQLEIERYAVQELVRRSQLVEGQGLHPATIRKILRCQGVDKDSIALVFKAVNLQLELEDYTGARRVLELGGAEGVLEAGGAGGAGEQGSRGAEEKITSSAAIKDWGEAVDVTLFCGRLAEISNLQQWVLSDRCRLVALLGNGGIGKTTLVTKLAEQIQDQFEFLIWRSLRNAPLLPELLDDVLKVLSSQQTIELPSTTAGKISKLIEYLRQHRCLLVLDNWETLMQDGSYAGSFQPEYEGYGELLRRVGEVAHQSCLLITSREKPDEIAALAGETLPVRSLQLTGLNAEAQEILTIKGLSVSQQESQQLIDLYSGNPLALKIVATAIKDLFTGDVAAFLATGISSFNSIRALLNQQFERLTETEKSVMYWLAINREGVSLYELADDIYPQLLKHQLLEAVESILRRSLMEQSIIGFTQQPVIMEYVTEQFIEQMSAEIVAEAHKSAYLPITHALLKATAKDYIQDSQIRLIVKPVIAELLRQLGSKKAIAQQLMQILARQREQASLESGYLAGNILNLLHHLEIDFRDYDFSHALIWQADLRGINLHRVNFTNAHFSKCVFRQIFGSVLSAAFSPDGEFLATGDDNGEVHLWRVADGQLHLSLKGNALAVQSLCFSLDGQTLISHSADQSIQFWDLNTGQTVRNIQRYTSQVLAIACNSTGSILISRGRNQTLSLWDLNTGKSLIALQDQSNQIQVAALSLDGELLATAGGDEPIRLWNTQTGKCLHSFYGHRADIQCLTWSDKKILASGSDDNTVKLWDVETGQCISTLAGHSNSILSVSFSSDGLIIASGSADQTISLWDLATGKRLRVLSGHENWVRTVVFNADSAILASGGDDQVIRLWDTTTGQCIRTLQGYTNQISAIGFDNTGQILASGSQDRLIRLWDTKTGQCIKVLAGHTNHILAIALHPMPPLTTPILASSSTDRSIKLWNIENGECLKTLTEHQETVYSVTFSPNGQILASGSADRTARIWDAQTGECLDIFSEHTNAVLSVAFSPDGEILATASADQTIGIWNLRTGECLQILHGHTNAVLSVTFSPDGRTLASGSGDRTLKLWDVETGKNLRTLQEHTNQVLTISFSHDGRTLASGSADCTLKLWAMSSVQCLKTWRGHNAQVLSVVFSPDGETLASSSADETIRLWSIHTGENLRIFRANRPYEGMNITGATGLTEAQRTTLKALGADSK